MKRVHLNPLLKISKRRQGGQPAKKTGADTARALTLVKKRLSKVRKYRQAAGIVDFDRQTVCPDKGMARSAEISVTLESHAFRLLKDAKYIEAVKHLYKHLGELSEPNRVMVSDLYREYMHTKRISRPQAEENGRAKNEAWISWLAAKESGKFDGFADCLEAVRKTEIKRVMSWETLEGEENLSAYDRMLSEHERGMTSEILDGLFTECSDRITALLKGVLNSGKQIRTDFMSRGVTDEQQKEIAEYLLDILHFDRSRGALSLSEHPMTEMLTQDDVRITTNFEPESFLSSFYSILHECGHALFELESPEEDFACFIENNKSMGMHESVSRFYENVIGRSKEFIHLVYPKLCEVFPQVLFDVTERELYEAVNEIKPSLIRVDADEVTYLLHIIIRYEIEKDYIGGKLKTADLPKVWNEKYKALLGITPNNDSEGVLQDVHWTSDFGYFPTYALGNFYNAMYYKTMKEDFNLSEAVEAGDFGKINRWMRENVFAAADMITPKEWIESITGRSICATDYLEYIEGKINDLYGLIRSENRVDAELEEYARRIIRIRLLSSPQLDGIITADAYRNVLTDNFRKISELAQENRFVLNELLAPILNSHEPLPDDLVKRLQELNLNLMDVNTHDNIDLPIMSLLSERLMEDARGKNNDDYLVAQLDELICACVALVVQTRRITSTKEIIDRIRERGIRALDELMGYLDKEKFAALSEESREMVMIDSRYGDGLFLTMVPLTEEQKRYRFDLLERSLSYSKDPFYREMLPDYDWKYHEYRIYQYISSFDEFNNAAGFNKEQLKKVAHYGDLLETLWLSDRPYFEQLDLYSYIRSHRMRNRMHAGMINPEDYRREIRSMYGMRNPNRYDVDNIIENIELPVEYMITLDKNDMTEEQKTVLENMYADTISYVFRVPKLGIFYEMMDYFSPLIFNFLEVPGGTTFEEIGLKSLAAFHPPTYIHSVMVAKISRCLLHHMLRRDKKLLTDCKAKTMPEATDAEFEEAVINFIYHAALCHDFGKLIIIDTIFTYGRNILDSEFDIIKQHPELGAELLSKHRSTYKYADIARGHHLWYDKSNGYPSSFNVDESPYKTMIEIVACADCMDAATDRVGRSYSAGKTLDEYIGEVKEGAGTRYAPYLPELLTDETVRRDLDYLLSDGRRETYRSIWLLLRNVQDGKKS